MSRADVVADVLDLALDRSGQLEGSDSVAERRWRYMTGLAIIGALAEYERGERSERTSKLFDGLRAAGPPATASAPVAEPAGAEAPQGDGNPAAVPPSAPGEPVVTDVIIVTPGTENHATVTASKMLMSQDVRPAARPEPATYACDRCGRTFATPGGLGGHKGSCGRTFSCDRCGREFATRGLLVVHQRRGNCAPAAPAPDPVIEEPAPPAEAPAASNGDQPAREDIDVDYEGKPTGGVHQWRIIRYDLGEPVASVDYWPTADAAYRAFDRGGVVWKVPA